MAQNRFAPATDRPTDSGRPECAPELLLRSHGSDVPPGSEGACDTIDVLPALPDAWVASGSFDGLTARGGFTIGATWTDSTPTELRIRSSRGGVVRLRCPAAWPGILEIPTRRDEAVLIDLPVRIPAVRQHSAPPMVHTCICAADGVDPRASGDPRDPRR